MKKILITFIALATLWSCQTDEQYENLNRDPKNPTEVDASFLFSSAVIAMSDVLQSPNVNINIFRFVNQYLTATTYLDEPNYDLQNRGIPGAFWSEIYQNVLYDLEDAKAAVPNNTLLSATEQAARIAQIEVMQVYAWQILVDTFGDIPYTDALQPAEITLPTYDDAATIYADLISRLIAAKADLASGQGFGDPQDVIYEGDMTKWSKFANSLLLRLGMRISDSNQTLSISTVTAAIDPSGAGVFNSNEDNALIAYKPTFPNTNPMWEDFVRSGRSDYVAAETIIDAMSPLNDPRMPLYFDGNQVPYVGGSYGESNSYNSYTHVSELLKTPTIAGIFIDNAEVQFLLAEAAKTSLYPTTETAQKNYEDAVTASIEYWTGDASLATAYLAGPAAYDGTNAQLATQFWIAMFNNPFQGWCVWRKFDAPTLIVPPNAEEGGIPTRYTYPISERNLNNTNYTAASSKIGGDSQLTKLFWDAN